MARGANATGRSPESTRLRVFAAGLLSTGLLLFTWPFVRAPRFHLVPAFLHLLGAWVLVVAALGVLAHAARRSRPPAEHPRA
jgi:hypothetical protein